MPRILPSLRARRSRIALALLLSFLPACTSWHVGNPTPAAFIEAEKPASVRVTRVDGTTLDLNAPEVRNDSLFGATHNGLAAADTARTVSLPLAEVQSVAVQKVSAGKTILLVAGITVGVFLIVYAIECAGASGWEAIGCP